MKAAQLLGLCAVILVVMSVQASAQPQISYESAAVGRIVGESADEMMQQFMRDNLQLGYATYYADNNVVSIKDTERAEDTAAVIEAKFPEESDTHLVESLTLGRWGWGDVKESIDNWGKKSFLLLESHGDAKSNKLEAKSPAYFDSSLTPSSLDWNFNEAPLILWDSDFAGIHLPKKDSFVKKLNKDAVVIAPTAIPDSEFARVFACNLGKYATLGETYRNARNNYYWNTNKPSGIALMSYELYGNPTAKISVPAYDESSFEQFCKDFLKDYSEASVTSSVTVAGSRGVAALSTAESTDAFPAYTKESVFTIDSYAVLDNEEFSFLVASGTILSSEEGQLILPKATVTEEFPLKTVVTGVKAVSFSNPVNFTIDNLPMWFGGPVERECLTESEAAGLGYTHSFSEDRQNLAITISPAEVVNCAEGKLRLYTEVKYFINYIPYSSVLIKDVTVPTEATPKQDLTAAVTLENLQSGSFEGELVLSSDSTIIAEKSVAFAGEQQQTVQMPFKSTDGEGITPYKLEFVQNSESKTFHTFDINVKTLEISLQTPLTAGESGEVTLSINNRLPTPIESTISAYVAKDETESNTQSVTLLPGENTVKLGYEGLKKEDASYEFLATLQYGNSKQFATATLVTNHPPMLKPMDDITITEGKKVILEPLALDVDSDTIEISYSGDMESNEWQTKIGDAGDYEVVVTASDGLLEDSQIVKITVLENKDIDEDGYETDIDCNDLIPRINPGAEETCNNEDDNCNGNIDENLFKEEQSCGFNGVQTLTCTAGKWIASSECIDSGECSPDSVETAICGTEVGMCSFGEKTRSCSSDYKWSGWSECIGSVEPAEELCDGLDNDCNGKTDGGFADLDKDGVADCVDTDTDGDGVKDNEDNLIGDKTAIETNIENIQVEIGGEKDGKKAEQKVEKVRILEKEQANEKPIVEFDFDFSKKKLKLNEVKVEKETTESKTGFTIIKGLLGIEGTKTVYVNKLSTQTSSVCIKDAEISSASEVTSKCTGSEETLLNCNSAPINGYTCTLYNGRFRVDGLKHSGIVEMCYDTDTDGYQAEACGGKDCNDNDKTINLGKAEKCNDNTDNNCNTQIDEGCTTDLKPEPITCASYTEPIKEGMWVMCDTGITNKGSQDTSRRFNIKWYLDGQEAGAGGHTRIPAGQTVMNDNSQYLWTSATTGQHTIKFEVNTPLKNNPNKKAITESNYDNNFAEATINIQAVNPCDKPGACLADLIPEPITCTSTEQPIRKGLEVNCDTGITNKGSKDTGTLFNFKWIVDGQETGLGSHEAIPAGQTVMDGNSQYTWTPTTAGQHTIKFEANIDYPGMPGTKAVAESNYDNNIAETTINVAD